MTPTRPLGTLLPDVRVPPPGPASRAMSERLGAVESRNVTYGGEGWPVFWDEAAGANVRDADGNVYVDLTSAFGVALVGHGHPAVRAAVAAQAERLVHGMGDVHPPVAKLTLLERLVALAPWDDARAFLATSGAEAVEAALKTARLASGRPGILAFEGGYHGLTLGALAATERPHFRAPFADRVYGGVAFAPFPDPMRAGEDAGSASLDRVAELLDRGGPNGDPIGSIVVEPVQARGGARVPPPGFMEGLTELARRRDVLIVADEIMTGVGRCGAMFASNLVGLAPDIVCVGKALGGGLPLSAVLAPARVMDAWPASEGEAIHTSTFLGHPLACAAATAVLDVLVREDVIGAAERIGRILLEDLGDGLRGSARVGEVRGLGLLLGIELVDPDGATPAVGLGARVAERALAEGVLVLPAGDEGHVVELTPPVALTNDQIRHVVDVLTRVIEDV